MTGRERIIAAINHQETDYIPYHIGFTHQEYDKVAAYLKDAHFTDQYEPHMSSVYYDGWPKEITPGSGYFKDDFGVVWNRNGADKDIGVVDYYVIKEPIIGCYTFPEPDFDELRRRIEKLIENPSSTFKFVSIGFSLFERAWSLYGMENLLAGMVEEPEFVEWLLDAIADFNLNIIDLALEYDIDGFMFGDDWGQQSGLIMGPNYWRKFIKPRLQRMYSRVKSKGKYIIQHSCGDIHEIMPDLIELGLDVYQTFQPEIYDIGKIKAQFGKHLTFWGGISTQTLLPFATPEEVKKVTVETLKIMKPGGGYIAAPTHDVPGDVPPENIVAMMEVLRNQHRYL